MLSASRFDFQQNHFQLFGFEPAFVLDLMQLEQQYRELQSQVHPDRFGQATQAEQRVAMQRASLVNEAYQTLRSPLNRARYLLALRGIETQEETNTAMPVDFLMLQMEWREAIGDARQSDDLHGLTELETKLSHEIRQMEQELASLLDHHHNYLAAAELVRKLRFMEKLAEEIHSAFDELDG